MGARNMTLGLVFLMAVLAFTVFAAKRLLFRTPPASGVAALLEKAKLPVKPPQPKPSAAVPAPAATAPSSSASPSAVPSASNSQPQTSAPPAGGAVAGLKNEPSPAAKSTATVSDRPQLRLESGARLWIHVTAISRKPDGSFRFRGTLLQPVELANANRLDQGTELSGSGAVNNGHVTVLVKDFTVGGANYALLQNVSGSNKRPGTGLAVELDPGKLLEVWIASSSVYRKAP
jgi:hypothetical protein